MPFLFIVNEHVKQAIALDSPVLYIGRHAKTCDVVLDNPAVSRLHLIVRHDGLSTFVTDNNTRNGTFVNGDRLTKERELLDGNVIEMCGMVIEFHKDAPVDQLSQ